MGIGGEGRPGGGGGSDDGESSSEEGFSGEGSSSDDQLQSEIDSMKDWLKQSEELNKQTEDLINQAREQLQLTKEINELKAATDKLDQQLHSLQVQDAYSQMVSQSAQDVQNMPHLKGTGYDPSTWPGVPKVSFSDIPDSVWNDLASGKIKFTPNDLGL